VLPTIKILFLASLTLIAFAGNSVLCRLALEKSTIDPYSFTALRLFGAVLVLVPLSRFIRDGKGKTKGIGWPQGSWRSGCMLYVYAAAFSMAYSSLSSGTGALILFGAVQITMLLAAHRNGERMRTTQWAGFGVAIAGIIYLVSPGISAPNPQGALLMSLSGVAWGLYSIAGRGSASLSTLTTSGNFLRAAPLALLVSVCALSQMQLSAEGIILALISGVITSGIGYVIWYMTLPKLTTHQAAMTQLLVPPIATIGGVLFIHEPFTTRLGIASMMVIGGVAWSILRRSKTQAKH
jgi:drug/metabolite transporter (DMT)-like permease